MGGRTGDVRSERRCWSGSATCCAWSGPRRCHSAPSCASRRHCGRPCRGRGPGGGLRDRHGTAHRDVRPGRCVRIAAQVWGAPLLGARSSSGPRIRSRSARLPRAHDVDEDDAAAGCCSLRATSSRPPSGWCRWARPQGSRVLAVLEPVHPRGRAGHARRTLDDIGGACFRLDIASMRHETQYTRLFRT